MSTSKRITEMWAYVAIDADGDEGVLAVKGKDGAWFPLVGADTARMESVRPVAMDVARREGKKVKLLRFTTRQDEELF